MEKAIIYTTVYFNISFANKVVVYFKVNGVFFMEMCYVCFSLYNLIKYS